MAVTPNSLPLSGVKVLEMGSLIAGPFCARILAEFGSEIIKVEVPKIGDPLRKWRALHNGLSKTPGQVNWLGSKIGEHNLDVLKEIGLTNEMIQDMANKGVI
ncbi:CoA transferase [Fictibacillus terranigra]|uniref:CoA transferase n=1 Tax=Fictibacillus terranigra TaxID=3058424 RepID=UPI003CD0E049